MNHNLVLGRSIENHVWIGRRNHAPQAAFARTLTGMGMLQQEIDNGLNAGLHMTGTLAVTAPRYRPTPYRVRQRPVGCSAVSQAMLRPDGAHLFVRRKFTAIRLSKGFVKRSFFNRTTG